MHFSLMITSMLVVSFTAESIARAIIDTPNSHQPTKIVRDVRSVYEGRRTGIVRDGRAMEISSDVPNDSNNGKTRLERSPAGFSPFGRAEGEASAPRRRARSSLIDVPEKSHEFLKGTQIVREERSPAYTPFGRAEGEASAPRRRARSPLESHEKSHESLKGIHIVREERSPAYTPFGRAEGEASAPRRRARSPVFSHWASAPRRRY